MSILSDFEDRLARGLEGLFAGAFRSPVQPAEVAKALAHAMDDERMVGVGKIYAPVSYSVYLSDDDADNLGSFLGVLAGELSTYLVDHARERGYHLAAKPVIDFYADAALKLGRFRVDAAHDYGSSEAPAPPAASVPPPEPVAVQDDQAPSVLLETLTVGDGAHDVVLRGERVRIGRLSDCDICLEDANVSRRHAEVVRVGDDWYVRDLQSTNGTRLNGRRIDREKLEDGDVIEVGMTQLVYHRTRG